MAPVVRALAAALALASAALSAGACSAQAAPDAKSSDLTIPCNLPKDAVQTVPAPFDRYMALACTAQGQALRPAPGYYWKFPQGPMWLLAAQGHFTELTVVPMSDHTIADLRGELHRVTSEPSVFTREIIRMDVTTSAGDHKQEFLLVPPAGSPADVRVLGMECLHFCIPIDKDPWFFVVMPGAAPKP